MAARLRSCRPGYSFVVENGAISAACCDGSLISWIELSDTMRAEGTMLAAFIHAA